tara:strand:+ start:339 stop:467 length:129 start_codon:yes stop_codon:yes gene_type:complete
MSILQTPIGEGFLVLSFWIMGPGTGTQTDHYSKQKDPAAANL